MLALWLSGQIPSGKDHPGIASAFDSGSCQEGSGGCYLCQSVGSLSSAFLVSTGQQVRVRQSRCSWRRGSRSERQACQRRRPVPPRRERRLRSDLSVPPSTSQYPPTTSNGQQYVAIIMASSTFHICTRHPCRPRKPRRLTSVPRSRVVPG
jgi:hypothetical protein